jgi:glycosyltransferase involved in cell wall biosynthesis
MPAEPRRLLFVVTEDWYFCSHRLPLARAALDAGYRVAVATRVAAHAEAITANRIELLPLRWMRRSSTGPLTELRALLELIAVYRRWRPALVHHVALKPVLYGSFAAFVARVPARVNALAGLGFVFASTRRLARAARPFVRIAYRLALRSRRAMTIVQNPDDRQLLVDARLVDPARVRLVRGSGVDLDRFRPGAPAPVPVVMLMSRMLWDKGVAEFVDAARRLRADGVGARFVLVGEPDDENPSAIPRDRLAAWHAEGAVEWWGGTAEPHVTLARAGIVCLPSYREGLPKVLLEAAACGLPMVASDVPGCREIVIEGQTGLRVPARDAAALAQALRHLIDDAGLRARLGAAARRLAEQEFGIGRVVQQTLAVYDELQREQRHEMQRCARS